MQGLLLQFKMVYTHFSVVYVYDNSVRYRREDFDRSWSFFLSILKLEAIVFLYEYGVRTYPYGVCHRPEGSIETKHLRVSGTCHRFQRSEDQLVEPWV